jgi:hypothetical protein
LPELECKAKEKNAMTQPHAFLATPENLKKVLSLLAEGYSIRSSLKAIGSRNSDSLIWNWLKKSYDGHSDFLIEGWPSEDNPPTQFFELFSQCRRMAAVAFESHLRECTAFGDLRVVRRPGSNEPVYRRDLKAMGIAAQTFADPESEEAIKWMREFEGFEHYPFLLGPNGELQPELERVPSPAALRVHAARSTLGGTAGWNPSQMSEVNAKVAGRVLVIGAATNNKGEAPRPSYAKPERETMSALQLDLQRRLADLREHGPRNPKPLHPPKVNTAAGDNMADDVPRGPGARPAGRRII